MKFAGSTGGKFPVVSPISLLARGWFATAANLGASALPTYGARRRSSAAGCALTTTRAHGCRERTGRTLRFGLRAHRRGCRRPYRAAASAHRPTGDDTDARADHRPYQPDDDRSALGPPPRAHAAGGDRRLVCRDDRRRADAGVLDTDDVAAVLVPQHGRAQG